ncbi:MAG TPA: glucose-6-phosphate isomerase [Elusimicrobia bacterium]|nr:MAG: glucose-6-phosphate isomerase [Elusimicrobia bacterium RIFOXYA12_FULL_49_49]OGS08363.1 MAG: glucose-6-phosphate isomerase [Elusimicrobia bacterium RIFOXYA1_FULL_47_7]OGS16598.1 MAG: glucose-6-phosphate isomerase [Elusimicrobia bacterium RIFOXYA2_FULL_47_53]OGS31576.1 MAG: glucose-6-phosphate isomerase [Elusimicrobia bacterium RIFOXYB2_FULL_46_23]HBU69021.1 glucose-6-phosphate isomerase [Elusimicrobiota bacterium]
MSDAVKLNYANSLTEFVGDQGITIEELKALQQKISKAHESIHRQKKEGKLGFMELPYKIEAAKKIKAAAKKAAPKFENFVVIGIGGSALGNIALQQALRHPYWNLLEKKGRKGFLKLFVPDNVDPDFISGLTDVIDPKKTLFNVISKSGSTAECLANYFILKKILQKKVGKKYNEHILVTTDAAKGYLREAVVKENLVSFEVPSNVGGRFSVMTPVGLLSAAFTGIDIEKLLIGAQQMDNRCFNDDIMQNPAALYAAIQYLFYWKKRPLSVMMPYSNALYGVADWYRQLWAESLGKKTDRNGDAVFVGPTPIKALGATDQHSQVQLYIEGPQDKVITFLSVEKFGKTVKVPAYDKHYLGGRSLNELLKAEEKATRLALTKEGRPNLTISLPEVTPEAMGQLLYMLELATAYAGELFDINAFDQPGVELGKQLTYALMGRAGYEDKKSELETELAKSEKQDYTA